MASESFVLLKNENQVLPLKSEQKVALVGPLADAKRNMPGTWSVATDFDTPITIKTELEARFGKENLE